MMRIHPQRNTELLHYLLACLILLPACSSSAPIAVPPQKEIVEHSSSAWFATHSEESLKTFAFNTGHRENDYTLLETVGGGVGMIDMDLDGDLDFYFAGGGHFDGAENAVRGVIGRLCENRSLGSFRDRSIESYTSYNSSLYSHGVHVWDYDQDGFSDLVITGYGGQVLLRNLGDGTFDDQTQRSGLDAIGWSTASVSGDFNRDGLPDLYVARYCIWSREEELRTKCETKADGRRDSCPPQAFQPQADLLFLNNGDGSFSDHSRRLKNSELGRGLGVVAADFNADGQVDIFVANDAGANTLYLNTADALWIDSAMMAGVSGNEFGIPEGSMGIATGDVNGDSQLDLFVTNFELENNSLYQNVGTGLFEYATMSRGLGGSGFQLVGFGTGIADFDGDGWQDLLVLNGNVFYHSGQTSYLQSPLLYKNMEGRFKNLSASGGEFFQAKHAGRGLAVGDIDNNGTPDFIAIDQEQPPTIALGQVAVQNWARIELRSRTHSNPPIGSSLQFELQGKTWTRWCTSGEGYLSSGDSRILIPVAANEDFVSIRVTWPNQIGEVFEIPVRTSSVVIEGHGVQIQTSETR